MSVKSILFAALFTGVSLGLAPAASAQAPAATPDAAARPAKVFKLLHESATAAQDLDVEEEVVAWVPGLKPGTLELSMSLGFMNLSGTLLRHEQMIYKYTTESTYWGDVEINGQTAFNPVVRLGYTAKPWLTVEGYTGLSISEYSSTVVNRHARKNEPDAVPTDDPALGEFDAESRSLITLQGGIDLLIYPLNFSDDGSGRWQPYLTTQLGKIWYDMNSDFTSGAAGSNDIAFGGGLRLLAERNVSLRLEAAYHLNSVEFKPAEYFLETNEGTTLVPLMEYPRLDGGTFDERPVSAFAAQDLSYLTWSIGFQGTF